VEQKTVRKLERELKKAIVDIVCRLGLRHLPLLPSGHTMEAMAKAAAAVYETAVGNYSPDKDRGEGAGT
jgi:MinD-like ATPase involved in chromosome partitioning or flagellar assembly